MKISDSIKAFKLERTIDEYKNNIGDNVHDKQVNFCRKLCDEFMNNDESNITVNTNRCGIGKSTVIKAFLNNLVNKYSKHPRFGTRSSRELELDCYGAIVIHDSIEGLEKIANYKGLTDRCYFMRFDKEDIEKRNNARVNFQEQLKKQFEYPIVLITTQKYFKMSDEERKILYKWKNGSRAIKIIDEKPYILATTIIDEVYLSSINIALEEIVKGQDKNYIVTCWKKIRNDLDTLRDNYANKYEIMWISKKDRTLLINETEDKTFFDALGKYVTTDIYDKVADIKKIYSEGCLFISNSDREQDNKRQFVLLHNNTDKFDMDKCKCFILDATSKFDIDYTINENFKFLHIDDKKEVKDINIYHVQTSTSQKKLLDSNKEKIDTISKFINEELGDKCFVATYGKKKGIYQKFYNALETKEIAYFGDIKGKNTWESYNKMAHVGLNRKSHSVYLQKYILLKNKANKWNTMNEEDITKEIEDIIQLNKGWYIDEDMNEIMMRDMVVDTIQNIMRIKCRHFSNEEMCNIFIICAKNYSNVVSRVNDSVGGNIVSCYIPDIFLAEATDNRKPVNGKEKTNPQIIKEYLEGLDKGKIVKIKDIIEGSGLTRKQIDKVREKNQWCKVWFKNNKGNKRGEYIVNN
ncbi:MAG: hypothetical protein Q4B63_11285 [Clostridium perfringens]|nr:hypothetical protein [Clostridium perfringens]